MKEFIHKGAKKEVVSDYEIRPFKELAISPELSAKLETMDFPQVRYSWFRQNAPGPDLILEADFSDNMTRIGPAPMAEELTLMLPAGEMAWRSEGGYYCSNRGKGRNGYRNLAEALSHSWIEIKEKE